MTRSLPILLCAIFPVALPVQGATPPPAPAVPGNNQQVPAFMFYMGKATNQLDSVEMTMYLMARVKLSERECIARFSESAKNGDVLAQFLETYFEALYFPSEETKGLCQKMGETVGPEILRRAKKGESEAQFVAAIMYFKGCGVEVNTVEARYWSLLAAEKGHPLAIIIASRCLAEGRGGPPDVDKAINLLKTIKASAPETAMGLLSQYSDSQPYQREYIKKIRQELLFQAIGMQIDAALSFLSENKLITDVKNFKTEKLDKDTARAYLADGILLKIRENRIFGVTAHARGVYGFKEFRGKLPFGLAWNDNSKKVRDAVGGTPVVDHPGTGGRMLLAAFGNTVIQVLFEVQDDPETPFGGMQVFDVQERWGVDYNNPEKVVVAEPVVQDFLHPPGNPVAEARNAVLFQECQRRRTQLKTVEVNTKPNECAFQELSFEKPDIVLEGMPFGAVRFTMPPKAGQLVWSLGRSAEIPGHGVLKPSGDLLDAPDQSCTSEPAFIAGKAPTGEFDPRLGHDMPVYDSYWLHRAVGKALLPGGECLLFLQLDRNTKYPVKIQLSVNVFEQSTWVPYSYLFPQLRMLYETK